MTILHRRHIICYLLFGVFLLLVPTISFAQEEWKFEGQVQDLITRKPISDANILLTEEGTGTSTDEDGFFFLTTESSKVSIQISHISYQKNILDFDLRTTD